MTMEFPKIRMVDVNGLTELLAGNLVPYDVASMMVFTSNGLILAHASALPIERLRSLAATYSAAYTTHREAYSASQRTLSRAESLDNGGDYSGEHDGPEKGQSLASSPSPSYKEQSLESSSNSRKETNGIVFDDGDVVAIVVGVTDQVFLGVMDGSRQMQELEQEREQDEEEQQQRFNDELAAATAAATKKRRLTSPVTGLSHGTSYASHTHGTLSGESPAHEPSTSGSLPTSLAMPVANPFYTNKQDGNVHRLQMQDAWRPAEQRPPAATIDPGDFTPAMQEEHTQALEEWKEQHEDDLRLLESMNMEVSAERMWALQAKAQTMAGFLKKSMAGLELPTMF